MSKYKIPKCRVRIETADDGSVKYVPETQCKLWIFPIGWHCHPMMWAGYSYEPEHSQRWAEEIIERFRKDYQNKIDNWIRQDSVTNTYYIYPKD